MHAWEAIQKTIDHIEEHICEDIAIETLAQIAALSVFYYQRLFAQLVKKPVREYIKLRRLARASTMLRDSENRIIDVAMAYGFCSHETFTRAFKEAYGITPAKYRREKLGLNNYDKPDLLLHHITMDEGVPLISDGLVLEMNRKTLESPIDFLGIKGYFSFQSGRMLGERPDVSSAGEIWRDFHQIKSGIPKLPGGREMGVCYHGGAPEGSVSYFAGAEVALGTQSPPFENFRLPAREYAVCSFASENMDQSLAAALAKAMKFTRIWLKQHGLRADGFFPEIYYPHSPDSASIELWTPFHQREK